MFGKLCSVLGIELNKVECASESDRLTNLAGGFIDIGVVGLGNAQEYEKAGKLKVIGTVAGDGITIIEYPAELPENYKTLQEQTLEAREKLARIRPKNLGQAGRIPGVSPSDVAQLSIALAAGPRKD